MSNNATPEILKRPILDDETSRLVLVAVSLTVCGAGGTDDVSVEDLSSSDGAALDIVKDSWGDLTNLDLSLVGSTDYGNIYRGTATRNGLPADVLLYTGFGNSVSFLQSRDAGGRLTLIGGSDLIGSPPASATYRGTNVVSTVDLQNQAFGTFEMNIDFGSGDINIVGLGGSSIEGSGLKVDAGGGGFSGDVTINYGNSQLPGTFTQGLFHGDGSTGVTGIYVGGSSSLPLIGAMAGTR